MRRPVLALLGVTLLAVVTPAGAQSDNIRGRVVGPNAAAIPGANVVVTARPGRDIRRARTDERGEFVVMFASARLFEWRFTRQDLTRLLSRCLPSADSVKLAA